MLDPALLVDHSRSIDVSRFLSACNRRSVRCNTFSFSSYYTQTLASSPPPTAFPVRSAVYVRATPKNLDGSMNVSAAAHHIITATKVRPPPPAASPPIPTRPQHRMHAPPLANGSPSLKRSRRRPDRQWCAFLLHAASTLASPASTSPRSHANLCFPPAADSNSNRNVRRFSPLDCADGRAQGVMLGIPYICPRRRRQPCTAVFNGSTVEVRWDRVGKCATVNRVPNSGRPKLEAGRSKNNAHPRRRAGDYGRLGK